MIDLRSDTLTMPDQAMLETILTAPLGDDGRLDGEGRGEDPTINALEDRCAALTGKEAALLFPSGTMGNQAALLTWCSAEDRVLVEERQHLYRSEKMAFQDTFSRLRPVFYHLDGDLMPNTEDIRRQLSGGGIRLLCVENTHNFSGGACITESRMKEIYDIAQAFQVPVHMDGARLFNAAAYLGVEVKALAQYADSVMFCFSKGLAAPVGSILCGSRDFIRKAKDVRKLLGGALRQGGIIAAPALYALKHNAARLAEDNANCQACADALGHLRYMDAQPLVETNILVLDIQRTGLSQEEVCRRLKERGLWIKPVLSHEVRLVFYKGITREDALEAARILREFDASLGDQA